MGKLAERIRQVSPSLTLAISAKEKEMKKQGLNVIGFGAGEPDFDTPEVIRNAGIEAIQKGQTRYTPAGGTLELKKAIADNYERKGLTYNTNQIVVNNGAKHSLYNIFQVLLNPGDEVIIFSPFWLSYPEMVRLADGVPIIVSAEAANGFQPNISSLEKAFSSKTKAVIINSPSNPTGAIFPEKTIRQICELALKHKCWIISDEIYDEILFDRAAYISPAKLSEEIKSQTLIVNGVSKSHAMTGWRIGFILGDKEIIEAIDTLQSHSTSNPTSISQYAAVKALSTPISTEMVKAFSERRDYMVKTFAEMAGVQLFAPQGAFYVFPKVSNFYGKSYQGKLIKDSISFCAVLLETKLVAIVPGISFGAEDYVRLSFATSLANIQEGLKRFKEFLEELA